MFNSKQDQKAIKMMEQWALDGAFAKEIETSPAWKAVSKRFQLLADHYKKALSSISINDTKGMIAAGIYQQLIFRFENFAQNIPQALINEGKMACEALDDLGVELPGLSGDKGLFE